MTFPSNPVCLGIDFGTSGVRATAIAPDRTIEAEERCEFSQNDSEPFFDQWRDALEAIMRQIPGAIRQRVQAIAINGTSATVLWCDAAGVPIKAPLLYNDSQAQAALPLVRAIAPDHHPVISASSSFAKWVWWQCQAANLSLEHIQLKLANAGDNRVAQRSVAVEILTHAATALAQTQAHGYLLHQADWLAFLLHGQISVSDYHNCLKLGYDVQRLRYPDWMQDLPASLCMPQRVLAPGSVVAPATAAAQARLGLASNCQICAGTTDSIAAFLASEAQKPGEAVTSLGSTLVIKLLSETPVNNAAYGIYSHRLDLPDGSDRPLWLVGGASNTGGAVLRQFFSDADIERLSRDIDPNHDSPLDYYPLTTPGDRFPINDPDLSPRLSPRPQRDEEFLHGILQGIARIEAQGYRLLESLGASPPTHIYTAGGGAKNSVWARIRQRQIGVSVSISPHTEAAYGSALLAQTGTGQSTI